MIWETDTGPLPIADTHPDCTCERLTYTPEPILDTARNMIGCTEAMGRFTTDVNYNVVQFIISFTDKNDRVLGVGYAKILNVKEGQTRTWHCISNYEGQFDKCKVEIDYAEHS